MEFQSGPAGGKGRQINIGLVIFRLTVVFVDLFYLDRVVGHDVKILDFFGGVRENSEKSNDFCLVKEQ